jgi:hypothetical protein
MLTNALKTIHSVIGGCLNFCAFIFILTMICFALPFQAAAGNLNPPAPPDDPASGSYTAEDLWNRLLNGDIGEKRSGPFSEPASGPANYGHTIDDLMSIAPSPDTESSASPEEVLEGTAFWCLDPDGGKWGTKTGTMKNHGRVEITPGMANQSIAAGYHDGSGFVYGDTDLIPGNIAAGKDIFGVIGSAVLSVGDAAEENVLEGRTFSKTGAAGLTGTMPNNGTVNFTPGTSSQTIPAGYHNGQGTVAGDGNLVSGNIRAGVSIFGVGGKPQVVDTTVADNTAGISPAAPGDIRSGKRAFVNGSPVTGTIAEQSLSDSNTTVSAGIYTATTLETVDKDLASNNIKADTTIFGITGTAPIPSGDALAADVRTGKTFSNIGGVGIPGAMPEGGNVTGTDGQLAISLPNGYYDGKTATATDSELVSDNIKAGADIFGVTGNPNVVNTSSGDAASGDILIGKKAWVGGSEIPGAMLNQGAQTISPGAIAQTIPAGYHNGSGTVEGDADLIAGNIRNGVTIFGVTGNQKVVSPGLPTMIVYRGDEGDGNMGGRSGADARCAANLPPGYSNYRALISVSETDEVQDMPANYGVPKDRVVLFGNGVALANDWADLLDGDPLADTPNNAGLGAVTWVFTGTNTGGSFDSSFNCGGWTTTAGNAALGNPDATGSNWIAGNEINCSCSTCFVYCVAW